MSGAAGLAAAKRRRGLPQGAESPLQQSQNARSHQVQRIHPMQIIENHERRIRLIEEFAKNSEEKSNLSEVVTRIEAIEQENVSDSSIDLSKLEKQINTLEEQLNMTTQLLHKLQAFAIETNTSVMKMNKLEKVEKKDDEEGENTDEVANSSEST